MSELCHWCQRRSPYPLGAGEICEVCIGLCAFFFVPKREAAISLYEHSLAWVEQVFAFKHAKRGSLEQRYCWWCARPGQATTRLSLAPDHFYADPTLCRVCNGLLLSTLPPKEIELQQAKVAYNDLCYALQL